MLLPLLASALLGAAPASAPTPTPRAARGAETVVHAPRLDRLSGVAAFLARAGALAPLLRPEAWAADFHPVLTAVDPFSAASLREAGIDPAGPATTSVRPEGRITCTRLADPAAFRRACEAALHAPLQLKRAGARSTFTLEAAGLRAGYVLQGTEACAFASPLGGPDAAAPLLKEATRLVGSAPRADPRLAHLPGALFVLRTGAQAGAVGLEGDAQGLQVEGTSAALPLPPFAAAGASPYAAPTPGLLGARAHVARAGLPAVVAALRTQVAAACPECPPAALGAVADAVGTQLTGHVLLRVEEVRARGSLRTPAARLFAPRQALAAEVADAQAVRAALAPLARLPGASPLPDGHALAVPGGTLLVRLVGRQLLVGNDAAATDALARSLSAPSPVPGAAPLAHGAEFTLDPRLVARGLAQISLLDVVGSRELAGLFALGAELGPLLRASEPAAGWVQGGAGGAPHRFGLRWRLAPSP